MTGLNLKGRLEAAGWCCPYLFGLEVTYFIFIIVNLCLCND
jgi:hypothetical protein